MNYQKAKNCSHDSHLGLDLRPIHHRGCVDVFVVKFGEEGRSRTIARAYRMQTPALWPCHGGFAVSGAQYGFSSLGNRAKGMLYCMFLIQRPYCVLSVNWLPFSPGCKAVNQCPVKTPIGGNPHCSTVLMRHRLLFGAEALAFQANVKSEKVPCSVAVFAPHCAELSGGVSLPEHRLFGRSQP